MAGAADARLRGLHGSDRLALRCRRRRRRQLPVVQRERRRRRRLLPDAKGRPRPQEWQCSRRLQLKKSVAQPWFEPFARSDGTNLDQVIDDPLSALEDERLPWFASTHEALTSESRAP
jgi:hypothetical protein